MVQFHIHNRHFLKKKKAQELERRLQQVLGREPDLKGHSIEVGTYEEGKIYLMDGKPLGFFRGSKFFVALHLLIRLQPE